jgi:hypothetical protein
MGVVELIHEEKCYRGEGHEHQLHLRQEQH